MAICGRDGSRAARCSRLLMLSIAGTAGLDVKVSTLLGKKGAEERRT
jgi:hypothetical protein